MTTTAEKLIYLNETKVAIRGAIVAKGVEVADDATFRSYAERIAEIEAKTPLQEKTIDITENGSYEAIPDEGYALGKVTANVDIFVPTQQAKTAEFTENGEYTITPDEGHVLSSVAIGINVPTPAPVIEALEVTENGTYEVAEGIDGYGPVVVSVSSGGGDIEVEPIVLTGGCSYACSGPMAGKYIELFGNTVSTKNITTTDFMFYKNTATKIPFEINIDNSSYRNMNCMFQGCEYLTELPKVNNAYPNGLNKLLYMCYRLREIPEDWADSWNFDRMYTYQYAELGYIFQDCYSLRRIPASFLARLYNSTTSSSYTAYYQQFASCYVLDEVVNMPINNTVTVTSNMFNNTFSSCFRLKNFTLATNEDGSAKVVNWKGQTMDFTKYVGYGYSSILMTDYNSGITADKEVKDDATYQALKDDPDWFTNKIAYARYNHDSAVNTINSLPDTSAYLATAGGTNTIKFKGEAGSATDGGAINTLTAEEIAVAVSKGWSVTFV